MYGGDAEELLKSSTMMSDREVYEKLKSEGKNEVLYQLRYQHQRDGSRVRLIKD